MKRIIYITVCLLLIVSNKVTASHIAGVELTAQHQTGNNYLITLSFYRDCSGVSADATSTVYFTSSCDTFSITLNQVSGSGSEIPLYCNSSYTTSCSGGSLFGIQKYEYQGTITLSPCADWVIYYTMCCRNPLNTIVNSTSADLYLEANLDNLNAPYNNLPQFTMAPRFVICNGQPILLNNSAIDPDGDSLVYKLVTPYDDGPNTAVPYVTYAMGYSAQQPFPSLDPVIFDSLTGNLNFTPNLNISCVYAIQVDEYRRINNLIYRIGSVMRDVELKVISCNSAFMLGPQISGINPNATHYSSIDTNYNYEVLGNTNLSFNLYPQSIDLNRSITMFWNNGIPDAMFGVTDNNTPDALGHFLWYTSWADTNSNPHCFDVTVSDLHCVNTVHYCINVVSHLNGIENLYFDDGISVYPNPVKDNITIEIKDINSKSYNVEIVNYLGQKLLSGEYTSVDNHFLDIEVSNLKNGVYFLFIKSENTIHSKKFIINR